MSRARKKSASAVAAVTPFTSSAARRSPAFTSSTYVSAISSASFATEVAVTVKASTVPAVTAIFAPSSVSSVTSKSPPETVRSPSSRVMSDPASAENRFAVNRKSSAPAISISI